MLLRPRSHHRAFHLGLFPLETLARDAALIEAEAARPVRAALPSHAGEGVLGAALVRYRDLFAQQAEAEPAAAKAPVPDDLARRVVDVKGAALFMDAGMVGICRIPESAWLQGVVQRPHAFAIVILVEHGRVPETGNLASEWAEPNRHAAAELRAGEIAVCIAGHIRNMGFAATADVPGHARLDAERLAVLAGLAVRVGEAIENPYLGQRFSLSVVSTEYALECDLPLAASTLGEAKGFAFWWGQNGARSGREWNRRAARASHLGSYPMETVRRVARPTTLILDEEVPRVPKRAAFFDRALQGDLGEKAQKERTRFSFKTPLSLSQLRMIRSMVPLQDGAVANARNARFADPAANARAIKSLSYFLGADLTGICEVPRYAWFSHKENGAEIKPYHRYAVVMLIDQGFDTMEGASGDDWISGAQSMRGYLRGAEIAGVMSEFLRAHGFPARAQTNADSDVLQIPLILWAGLGELSRIGEL
ncbi:MAG: Fe-S protein, partial [Proteobacteria bacterium]|nr:Fe-S protein [Pseudomonadota bacterium]